jgi:hypothetical protein
MARWRDIPCCITQYLQHVMIVYIANSKRHIQEKETLENKPVLEMK